MTTELTIAELLRRLGFDYRSPPPGWESSQCQEVYCVENGDIMGLMTAPEAVLFIESQERS